MFNDDDPNEYWGSWMEVFALKIGVENITDFLKEIKPGFDDMEKLAQIEMSLISLKHMREYFKRRADEIDEILDNHPSYGNRLKNKDTEEYPTGFNMPIDMHSGLDMPAGYPHSHSTADWKPDLDLVTNISDMIHGESNIIPFRYKDNNK